MQGDSQNWDGRGHERGKAQRQRGVGLWDEGDHSGGGRKAEEAQFRQGELVGQGEERGSGSREVWVGHGLLSLNFPNPALPTLLGWRGREVLLS